MLISTHSNSKAAPWSCGRICPAAVAIYVRCTSTPCYFSFIRSSKLGGSHSGLISISCRPEWWADDPFELVATRLHIIGKFYHLGRNNSVLEAQETKSTEDGGCGFGHRLQQCPAPFEAKSAVKKMTVLVHGEGRKKEAKGLTHEHVT